MIAAVNNVETVKLAALVVFKHSERVAKRRRSAGMHLVRKNSASQTGFMLVTFARPCAEVVVSGKIGAVQIKGKARRIFNRNGIFTVV